MEFGFADLCNAGQVKSRFDTFTVGAPWRLPSSVPGNASAIFRTPSKFIFIRGIAFIHGANTSFRQEIVVIYAERSMTVELPTSER